jgi:hypothetical protein
MVREGMNDCGASSLLDAGAPPSKSAIVTDGTVMACLKLKGFHISPLCNFKRSEESGGMFIKNQTLIRG